MPSPLDLADLRGRVQSCIDDELRAQGAALAEVGPDIDDLLQAIGGLMAGGKRLRAAFLYWGYRAARQPDSVEAVRLATAMEFFQAAALLHDDVMDDSDTRRGMPAAHRALAESHQARGWDGDAVRFGQAGAILAGNLCLGWTEELYATCGLPPEHLTRARNHFDLMRTQLMAGQFLDVVESVRPWEGLSDDDRIARARRVIRYKSAKYTIEHPLLIGAAAGGINADDLERLSRYGLDLGHAFQLRDDLLGVFGDPAETGKPAGDDLREGKRTLLVAHTLRGAAPSARERLESLLGRPDLGEEHVAELREIITESGAVVAVEEEIDHLAQRACEALGQTLDLEPSAKQVLSDLIGVSISRAS